MWNIRSKLAYILALTSHLCYIKNAYFLDSTMNNSNSTISFFIFLHSPRLYLMNFAIYNYSKENVRQMSFDDWHLQNLLESKQCHKCNEIALFVFHVFLLMQIFKLIKFSANRYIMKLEVPSDYQKKVGFNRIQKFWCSCMFLFHL